MVDFYLPSSKRELVKMIFPNWNGTKARLRAMGKDQLRAILIRLRKGNSNENT